VGGRIPANFKYVFGMESMTNSQEFRNFDIDISVAAELTEMLEERDALQSRMDILGPPSEEFFEVKRFIFL
jgi:hypothetical protein